MKSKQRHQLQTNELADHIGQYIKAIEPYRQPLIVGMCVVVVLVAGFIYLTNRQRAERGTSWANFYGALTAQDANQLVGVAAMYPERPAGLWAELTAGDFKLAEGSGTLYRDRDQAETLLAEAESHFLKVEQNAGDSRLLKQRARFGLAQTYESLCDVKKARESYEQAAQVDPDSVLGRSAQERAERLAQADAQSWFTWFEKYEPAPPAAATSTPGAGPNLPGDLDALPARPDLSFPGSEVSEALKDLSSPASAPDTDNATDTSGEEAAMPALEPAVTNDASAADSQPTEEAASADDASATPEAEPKMATEESETEPVEDPSAPEPDSGDQE